MTTEEYLKSLIAKVEQMDISREEKDEIYTLISKSIHDEVLPALVQSMPKDKLMELSKTPEKVNAEEYYALLRGAFEGDKVVTEIDQRILGILQTIDSGLK